MAALRQASQGHLPVIPRRNLHNGAPACVVGANGLQECGTSWLVALGLEETSLQAIPVCGDAEVGVDHAQKFLQ